MRKLAVIKHDWEIPYEEVFICMLFRWEYWLKKLGFFAMVWFPWGIWFFWTWIWLDLVFLWSRAKGLPERRGRQGAAGKKWTWLTAWWLYTHPSEKYEFPNWDNDSNPIYMGKFKKWQPFTTNQLKMKVDSLMVNTEEFLDQKPNMKILHGPQRHGNP